MNTIFPTWDSYTDALAEYMSTGFFSESFPQYAKLLEEYKRADLKIVQELLDAGYDAQDGCNKFIAACFKGSRYIHDFVFDYLASIVEMFIKRGAVVTTQMVDECFTIHYTGASKFDFEDECNIIAPRSIVLDLIGEYITTPLPGQHDWKNIKAMNWEEIPADIEYSMKCAMYRKWRSNYLRSI